MLASTMYSKEVIILCYMHGFISYRVGNDRGGERGKEEWLKSLQS